MTNTLAPEIEALGFESQNPRGYKPKVTQDLSHQELKDTLISLLDANYHHLHPFNIKMHKGELSKEQVRGWIANRYYYQINIPIKDAYLMTKIPAQYRREWIKRIITHDGDTNDEGGIEAWLRLGEAAGLKREEMTEQQHLQAGVQYAVDAYVNYCRDMPWFDGIASSLTELFAPRIMKGRTFAFLEHYPWLEPSGLQYFKNRLTQAPREANHCLSILEAHATSAEMQQRVVDALFFKTQMLWSLLDAVMLGYPDE